MSETLWCLEEVSAPHPRPTAQAVTAHVLFVHVSCLVFIADVTHQGLLPHPVQAVLQTPNLLPFQKNLPLQLLSWTDTARTHHTDTVLHRPDLNPNLNSFSTNTLPASVLFQWQLRYICPVSVGNGMGPFRSASLIISLQIIQVHQTYKRKEKTEFWKSLSLRVLFHYQHCCLVQYLKDGFFSVYVIIYSTVQMS